MCTVELDQLIADGDICECAACGELSAYSWNHVTARNAFRLDANPGEIAHIGAASSFEWECGHCGANNVPEDSPLLHPCYTHSED